MQLHDLIVTGLATWRISHMLVYERGPLDVFTEIRELAGVRHDSFGEPISWPDNSVLECAMCTSVWVGLALTILPKWVSYPFASSAVGILVGSCHEHLRKLSSR